MRGLFATRPVRAGEVLVIAWPIGKSAPETSSSDLLPRLHKLVQALRRECEVSERARRRLISLTDGWAGRAPPTLQSAWEALCSMPDEVPTTPLPAELSEEALVNIVDRNSYDISGMCFIFGLTSMMNHSCTAGNVSANLLPLRGDAMLFRAERDIREGEELIYRYFKVSGSVRARLMWGFDYNSKPINS